MLALFDDVTGSILIHIVQNISLSLENKFQYFLRDLYFFFICFFCMSCSKKLKFWLNTTGTAALGGTAAVAGAGALGAATVGAGVLGAGALGAGALGAGALGAGALGAGALGAGALGTAAVAGTAALGGGALITSATVAAGLGATALGAGLGAVCGEANAGSCGRLDSNFDAFDGTVNVLGTSLDRKLETDLSNSTRFFEVFE